MTERYKGERISSPIRLEAGSGIIPIFKRNETMPITLTPFLDHGRPAYITSTIRSSNVLVEAANELTHDESLRISNGAGKILEEVLDGHTIKGATVFTSFNNKPNILVVSYGDPFNPTGLRLYFHLGEYNNAKVLFQDARVRIKSAEKVERIFKNVGYTSPKGWDIKRKSS